MPNFTYHKTYNFSCQNSLFFFHGWAHNSHVCNNVTTLKTATSNLRMAENVYLSALQFSSATNTYTLIEQMKVLEKKKVKVWLGSDTNDYTTHLPDLQAKSNEEAWFHCTEELLSFLSLT
jgi:hypothetical protein